MAGEGYGRTNVVLDAEGYVHIVWSGTVGYEGRYHRYSADGGSTWTHTYRIPGLENSFGQSYSEMVAGPDDALHVATGVENQRYVAWENGVWSRPEVLADVVSDPELIREGGMPRIALTEGNRLIVLFSDNWAVYFTTKVIDADHQPVQAYDTPSTQMPMPHPTAKPTSTPVGPGPDQLILEQPATAPRALPSTTALGSAETGDPMTTILLGVIPSILMVAGFLLVTLVRRRS
jgi:hypothetical protein